MTFLFIDYETLNVKASGGRASQFAAIRTDENLSILEGRSLNIFCEQICDNIPSPEAALVTGITPQKNTKD
jgi:exodeoxyribonuclease-1